MGRKRNILIREYYIESGGETMCKICKKVINAGSLTNLKRHLQNCHADMYTDYEKLSKLSNKDLSNDDYRIKFTVEMSRKEVVDACIDMITTEARPLKFFDSKAFKTLTNPIFNGLKMEPITSRNATEFITEKCDQIKQCIINNLKGKIVSLKLDTATRNDRSILGVNVQLIVNKKIVIYTLAMVELKKKHTAQNLQAEIENILKNFQINIKQIYSITTDNGRNLVKCVELLSQNESEDSQDDESTYSNAEKITEGIVYENVVSIKCAAHTLQLSVKDFLSNQNQSLIGKARELSKLLRTASFR